MKTIGTLRRAMLLAGWTMACASAHATDLLVPAYFYPAGHDYWPAVTQAASSAKITAIFNPNSGPAPWIDPNYVRAIGDARAAGVKVIAYVHTSYARRPLSDVVAEINTYLSQYQLDGFFIDEMTSGNDPSQVQYYASLYNYIKGLNKDYLVINNPGVTTDEIYARLPVADKLVVFEGNADTYETYAPAAWQAHYSPDRFVHIVYGANAKQMKHIFNAAKRLGAGNLFVTDDVLPNPFDTLPPYWAQETKAAAKKK